MVKKRGLWVSMNLLSLIESGTIHFSKGQKRIAEYVLEHYDKAAFVTAARLGQTVGVSESTVVRFAMELGYDGYPQFQKALQELVKSSLTSVQRMEVKMCIRDSPLGGSGLKAFGR